MAASIYDPPAQTGPDLIPLGADGKPISGLELETYERLKHWPPAQVSFPSSGGGLAGPGPSHMAFLGGSPQGSDEHPAGASILASADTGQLPELTGIGAFDFALPSAPTMLPDEQSAQGSAFAFLTGDGPTFIAGDSGDSGAFV